jgi:ATP-dependent 26S proteasome regulatory subunit
MPWPTFSKEEAPAPTSRPTEDSKRYFQDMQDALFLRHRPSTTTTDAASPQQLEMAIFQKLDRAEELKRSEKLKESLALYEIALDEGLQVCKRLKDQSKLKARLLRGMSDAETIKRSISKQPKPAIPMNGRHSEIESIILNDFHVDPATLSSTTWNDIAGLAKVKQSLQENVMLPLLRPDLFLQGLRRPQNILLYGPPGTGKTMLVRACAQESQTCNLFVCSASNLVSKWMGDSEKILKALFEIAQGMAPSIIFVDEVDSILSQRKSDEHEASRRLKTEFMIQMDGIKQQRDSQSVLVISCTNCPWDIDEAVLRRFPKTIYVPVPDAKARRGLIQNLLKKAGRHTLCKQDVDSLVEKTKGWSCSDITALASEASYGPLRAIGSVDAVRKVKARDVRPISAQDFEDALKQSTKSISTKQLKRYTEWRSEHGST